MEIPRLTYEGSNPPSYRNGAAISSQLMALSNLPHGKGDAMLYSDHHVAQHN